MKHLIVRFFSSGLWIFVLFGALTAGLIVKDIVLPLERGDFGRTIGDGVHTASYEFNLHPCLVPLRLIHGSGNVKNGLPALIHPKLLSIQRAARINDARRDAGGFIQDPDRVIGVVINGVARAYPLPMLNWHEVVDDRLGGKPILVSYDGFCDSAAVYSRVVKGKIFTFGYSGLVYNANLLLYNHAVPRAHQSLWSQITGKAIAGPAAAAGFRLTPLPCQVVSWGVWKSMYPHTKMIAGNRRLWAAYRKAPYASSYGQPGDLRFPIQPLWKAGKDTPDLNLKSRLLAIWLKGRWHPILFHTLFAKKSPDQLVHLEIAGQQVVLQCWTGIQWRTATVLSPQKAPVDYSLLFAWYAQHPASINQAMGAMATPKSPAKAP